MEGHEDQIRVWHEAMRTSWLGLLIDQKSDSSVTKVIQQMSLKHYNGGSYTQAILRKIGCYRMWIDTHLLGMKVEATKDDPVPSQTQGCLLWTEDLRIPTKVSFKGGSPPSIPNPYFFLASPNLGDEISFKGGSLPHPKILGMWNK
jgi:hypothetical protein